MSTINGLPAHVLLVHYIVVLAPLTAVLAIVCALWPAARRRLVWLVSALAVVCVILTPVTTESGEWLEHHIDPSPALHTHTELGDTMIYVSAGLLLAAAFLAMAHVRAERGKALNRVVAVAMTVLVVVVGIATMVQVYRIGESGARSAWEDALPGN
jgi:hypothetical protein